MTEDDVVKKNWKPSEEQMEALERCVDYLDDSDNEDAAVIGFFVSRPQIIIRILWQLTF